MSKYFLSAVNSRPFDSTTNGATGEPQRPIVAVQMPKSRRCNPSTVQRLLPPTMAWIAFLIAYDRRQRMGDY